MSLGFSIHTEIRNIEIFQPAIEKLAVESGCYVEHSELSSTVSFCKLGDLFLNYKIQEECAVGNISVTGDCRANLLGAGFHKTAIESVDKHQRAIHTRFEVEDETDYYMARDFEGMRQHHFYDAITDKYRTNRQGQYKG